MATIGIIIGGRVSVPAQVEKLAGEVEAWAIQHHHRVIRDVAAQKIADDADVIVSLGGDGTLLSIARYAKGGKPVFIGVNFGTLGFLTEIAPQELISVLEGYFSGTVTVGTRSLLYTSIARAGKEVFASQVVNDVVIQKGASDPLIDLDVVINDEPVTRIRSDGLIVATPTGSTAYSLAAGGSIAYPSLEVFLLTPICPHSLTSRPLILPSSMVVSVSVPEHRGQVFALVDGQDSFELEEGDVVNITSSQQTVRFVKSPSHSYFEILRTKLNWGQKLV